MEGEAKRDALLISAITGIAGELEKHSITAGATLRILKSSLSRLPQRQQDVSVSLQPANSSVVEVDSRHLPLFSDVRSIFSKEEAATGHSKSSLGRHWNVLRQSTVRVRALGQDESSEGGAPGTVSTSPEAPGTPDIISPQTETPAAQAIQNLGNIPASNLRSALVPDSEDIDADQQQDDQNFQSVLAQTHVASVTLTEESRRIESGQRASLALRPNVVLLKLASPPMSVPHFGEGGWLHAERDLVISKTFRHSDASGTKLTEDQYYKYVNIDPSSLDAHVRACYRVYFGEQVSVPRPSGRVVPGDSDRQGLEEPGHQESDPLAFARIQAKKPFLPYSSWQTNSYVNLDTKINSNDPFETTRSDPRTRFLVQFKSLQMNLLDHPDFRGLVEPLFATSFIFSTGKNVGRRVCCSGVTAVLSFW